MSDTSIQKREPSGMELLAELARNTRDPQAAIEIAKQITELQIQQEKLSQAHERFEWEKQDRQDETDFGKALSACQAEIGTIPPDTRRTLKGGKTLSWFASYPHLDATVRPIYLNHGFAISYSEVENPPAGKVGVRAILSRGRIQREYTQFLALADGNQATTAADLDASSSSRCMRLLLIKIFNISVAINKDEMGVYLDQEFEGWLHDLDGCETKRDLYDRYQQIKKDLLEGSRKDKKEAGSALFDKLQQRAQEIEGSK